MPWLLLSFAQEVLLDARRHHLGDNRVDSFDTAEPEAIAWTVRVPSPLPELERGLAWALVTRLHHVVSANTRDYEAGSYHDEVRLGDRRVATLNEYSDGENAPWNTVWIPLPYEELAGADLSILAGQAHDGPNHDDFEFENARLAAIRAVTVRVTDRGGGDLPAKIVVGGLAPRLGPDYRASGAGRAVFTATGLASFWLPAGETYRITASHGPEYTVAEATVPPGTHEMVLDRAVETPGMVSADFHLHADPSGDSRVPLPDRITSYLAEGIEFVVATDHNHATDYGPAIRELGAGERIASSIGDEITTHDPGIGHFNAYPVTEAMNARGLTPQELLARLDRVSTPGRRVLQVNHPRDGDIGYFNLFGFDPETGQASREGFHFDFDAVEVYNGASMWPQFEVCLRDWFGLLRAGHRITATGNSDSHMVVIQDAGWPRNFVIVGHEGLATQEEVVAAVRAHRVILSAGPIVEILDGDGRNVVGEEVAPGELRVRVQAAPWVRVNRLRVVGPDGEVAATPIPESVERVRYEGSFPAESGWYVAIVEGDGYGADVLTHGRVRPWAFTNPVWVRR